MRQEVSAWTVIASVASPDAARTRAHNRRAAEFRQCDEHVLSGGQAERHGALQLIVSEMVEGA